MLAPLAIGLVGGRNTDDDRAGGRASGRLCGRRARPCLACARSDGAQVDVLPPDLPAQPDDHRAGVDALRRGDLLPRGAAGRRCARARLQTRPAQGACRLVSVGILLLLGAIGPLYRTAMLHDVFASPALPACVDQFAVGGIVAVMVSGAAGRRRPGQRAAWALVGLAVAVVTVTLAAVQAPQVPLASTWFDAGYADRLRTRPARGADRMDARPLLLGEQAARPARDRLPLGVHLWHEPLIHFALAHNPHQRRQPVDVPPTALAVLAVTCLVAAVQWRLVEAPSLRLRGLAGARARSGAMRARVAWRSWRARVLRSWSAATARNRSPRRSARSRPRPRLRRRPGAGRNQERPRQLPARRSRATRSIGSSPRETRSASTTRSSSRR